MGRGHAHAPRTDEGRRQPRADRSTGGQGLAAQILRLQRDAGNRAVAKLLRTPTRTPIAPPGTGYDGVMRNYGVELPRDKLTTAQKAAVSDYRNWMESTFDAAQGGYQRGNWAREAGTRVAAFAGEAEARAILYAELQRQIIQATGGGSSSWKVSAERGADGSYVFRGNPALEAQRVFVIAPDGSCHVGLAEKGLSGRGAGKTVNYDKLTRIGAKVPTGGGGGGGGGPKVEPHVTGGPKVGEGPIEKPGVRGTGAGAGAGERTWGGSLKVAGRAALIDSLVALVVIGLFKLASAWLGYEKNVESEEEREFRKLLNAKVHPGVLDALQKHAAEAEKMTNDHPEFTVYAIVTMDLDYEWDEWGIGGESEGKAVTDAHFVDLRLSFKKEKQTEKVVDKDHWSFPMSDQTHYIERSRVTYAVELDFGETPDQKEWRMFLHEAEQAVKRGMSARAIAEHSHFDYRWTPADEREEQRRQKWGERSLRVERENAARRRFVEAYIEYTFMHDLDEPWKAAIDYLHELERRDAPKPEPKKSGWTAPMGDKDKKALADWIAQSR
jgi:hypothetical protein